MFHAFLGEKLPDWKTAAALVRKIAENYKLPYYTMSPTYSICKSHGYLSGEHFTCPTCGKQTEVWSRITGYYRPIQNWNDGKVQEFADRKEYELENSRLEGRRLCDRETGTTPTPAPPPPPPRRSKRTACTSSPPSLAPTARLPKMSWKRRGSIIPPWMSVSTWIW